MTVAEICVSAYLVVGLLAAILIWVTLIASKRQDNEIERPTHSFLPTRRFREQKTRPSRFHL
jgi:hypothetical protein